MKVGITVPVISNFKGCVEMLQSFKTSHRYGIYIIPQWRIQLPLAKAWNLGIQMAFDDGCDYVIVANDDILFSPKTVDNLISEYERWQKEKVVMVTGSNIFGQLAFPYDILKYEPGDGEIADHPDFSCFMVKKGFFEIMGKFDENFVPAWYEDNDAHYRIGLLGYRAISSPRCPIAHFGRGSTQEGANSNTSMQYYVNKWGGLPGDEKFVNPFGTDGRSPKEWNSNSLQG